MQALQTPRNVAKSPVQEIKEKLNEPIGACIRIAGLPHGGHSVNDRRIEIIDSLSSALKVVLSAELLRDLSFPLPLKEALIDLQVKAEQGGFSYAATPTEAIRARASGQLALARLSHAT